MTPPRLYTREEIERAFEIKARGHTWAEVADQIGREVRALRHAIWRYRTGKMAFRQLERLARGDRAAELAEQGKSIGEIQRLLDIRYPQLADGLLRTRGIDAEMRRLYAKQPVAEARAA